MVLKKSNSHLNTGVTQRLTNRGAFWKHPNSRTEENPGTVSVFLTGHEDDSKENRAVFQHGLSTIYDYLDLRGPDLLSFYDRDGFTRPQFVFNEFSYTKSQIDANVTLSEKVQKMIDNKVLESMTQAVEVEIKIFKRCPQKLDNRNNFVFMWNSAAKKKKSSNTREERKMRRKKNNPNTHRRGIQRQDRASLGEELFSVEETTVTVPSRKIAIKIEEPYAIDARLVNKSYNSTGKIYSEERGKSCWKLKGFVNGLRSDFKGYNFSTLKEDETEAFLEVAEKEDTFVDEDLRCTADEDEEFTEYSPSESRICLADFITTGSKVQSKWPSDARLSKFIPINSASSEKVVRHPKGSCMFMQTTVEENDSDIDTDSGFEGNSSFKSDNMDDQDEERQAVGKTIDSDNFEFELMANIDDFISKSLEVQLILPPDIMDKMLSSSTANSECLLDDCCMTFGNCYPPTFLLTVNSDKGIPGRNSLYLTGKAAEVDGKHFWKWKIQVGKMVNNCEPEIEIVDRVMRTLRETIVSEITLKDLIHIFKEILALDFLICDKLITTSKLNSHLSPPKPKESAWRKLADFLPIISTQTIPLTEALGLMDNKNDRQVSEFSCSFQSGNMLPASSSIVCDICFLPCDFSHDGDSEALGLCPCGHIFCLTCWRFHVYLSLCNADSVHCMHSDCKQELNETTLRSLAPGHMVNKWLQRLKEKAIEGNALSKWCPNTHCDRVALLPDLSTKVSQFGSLVLCDCQHHWCFTCQTDPHWPASCEQTAAFRKLLAKTGNDLEIPAARVDYTIQLKRCPKCHYPIEKNQGCPSMMCRMCWFNFCWNCLRPVDHSVYTCKARDDNYDTFNLQNKLVHELPLKFFPDFLEMNRKRKNLEKRRTFSWLQKLHLYNTRLLKMPLNISLEIATNKEAKSRVINVAETTVEFLIQVYTFLESCYKLLSFVNMIKDQPRKNINLILHEFMHPAETLRFITSRLEDQVVYKRLSQILKYAPTADVLLECGRKHMITMAKDLNILQNLTKAIDTSRVGDLDPMNFLRYK